ncbi:hypothetical protein ARMGADRAFT_1088521 [Armillaria gallica]|uniref:Uncharacterized protein n=1 Tax=Armillaria gallica TaxID=47427 RepID=A0A2H3CS86_ARMGA|nr:hypothetical protein ARMGADRAFT_1088521 [Armillaria gallica]
MQKALIFWHPILNLATLATMKELLSHMIEHHKALIQAFRMDHLNSSLINTGDLVPALKSLGVLVSKPRVTLRTANIVEGEEGEANLETGGKEDKTPTKEDGKGDTEEDDWIAEVIQAAKRRQCPHPKEYYFPKMDTPTKLA